MDFNWHFIARRTRDREAKPPPNMAEDAWAPSSKWLRFRSILLVFCLLWRKQHKTHIEPALPPKPARRAGLFWSRLTATVLVPDLHVAFSNFATRSFTRSPGHPSKNRHISRLCSTGANGALTTDLVEQETIRFEHITYCERLTNPFPPPEVWLRRKSCIFCAEISLGVVGGIKRPAALVTGTGTGSWELASIHKTEP